VSAPLGWDELDACQPEDFTLATMPSRFAARGDVHAEMDQHPCSIERLLELLVALAPVQVGLDQLVDVGVDRKITRRVKAGPNREQQRKNHHRKGKARARSNNRDNNTCQHNVSFWSSGELPKNARCLAEFPVPI